MDFKFRLSKRLGLLYLDYIEDDVIVKSDIVEDFKGERVDITTGNSSFTYRNIPVSNDVRAYIDVSFGCFFSASHNVSGKRCYCNVRVLVGDYYKLHVALDGSGSYYKKSDVPFCYFYFDMYNCYGYDKYNFDFGDVSKDIIIGMSRGATFVEGDPDIESSINSLNLLDSKITSFLDSLSSNGLSDLLQPTSAVDDLLSFKSSSLLGSLSPVVGAIEDQLGACDVVLMGDGGVSATASLVSGKSDDYEPDFTTFEHQLSLLLSNSYESYGSTVSLGGNRGAVFPDGTYVSLRGCAKKYIVNGTQTLSTGLFSNTLFSSVSEVVGDVVGDPFIVATSLLIAYEGA